MSAIAEPPPVTAPKIPKLSDLTKEPGQMPPVQKQEPPVPPVAKVDPPAPPIPSPDEEPDIPTSVVGAEKKDTAAIIEQRRQAKAAREEAKGAVGEAEQFKIELATTRTEKEKLQGERDRLEQERKDFEALAKQREKEMDDLRGTYLETHKPVFDPGQDETFQSAHTRMMDELRANMPARIKTPAGDARVFFDSLTAQPGKLGGLHNIIDSFAKAKSMANEDGMDLAVNAMAQWLGADVEIGKGDKAEWRTLDKGDPAFSAIEMALQRAAPHYQTKAQRYQEVSQNAPVLARQAFEGKTRKLQESLSKSVFIPRDEAARRAQSDPNDGPAIISLILDQIPDLKAEAEALVAGYSETFATVNDHLYLPTLKGNDRAAIEEHQGQLMRHRQRLGESMRDAVYGRIVPKILAVVIAERDAAEERAARASHNTNPGDTSRAGGDMGGGANEPSIPTSIIGAEKGAR